MTVPAAIGVPAVGALVTWALALSVTDLRHRRLPNVLTVPGAAVILLGAAQSGRGTAALAGGLALAAVYLVVHLLSPAGMGAGDVKLAVGLGALAGAAGPGVWALAAVTAPLITACLGMVLAVAGRRRPLPHGPAMCATTLAALAWAAWPPV